MNRSRLLLVRRGLLLGALALSPFATGCEPTTPTDERPATSHIEEEYVGRPESAKDESPAGNGGAQLVPPDECLNRWLEHRALDPYGNPPGTFYAGGTPLFDPTTGTATSRWDFVLRQHPDVAVECPLPAVDAKR